VGGSGSLRSYPKGALADSAGARAAAGATRVERIHAAVGGFHLAPAPEEVVTKTLGALREIDPDYIIPMHCTGLNTIIAIHREMPGKLVQPSTGTRVSFGA
jgi:7,8-dihydropterin-6-yl-methyl-4-(beta-D-ribofuranosyl)aminobenzene 5'-phosphate synthase